MTGYLAYGHAHKGIVRAGGHITLTGIAMTTSSDVLPR